MAGNAGMDLLGLFVSRREVKLLRRRLEGDERVLGAVDARLGRRRGLLAATDRRILWASVGLLRRTLVSWPYDEVTKVEVGVGREGAAIDILLKQASHTFTEANRNQARSFAEAVKRASPRRAFRRVMAVHDPAAVTPLSELLEEPYRTRLARLERMRARGTITEPEYHASRKGILAEAGRLP